MNVQQLKTVTLENDSTLYETRLQMKSSCKDFRTAYRLYIILNLEYCNAEYGGFQPHTATAIYSNNIGGHIL